MPLLGVITAWLVCFVLSAPVRAQAPQAGRIAGIVTTQAGAVPLAGALVTLADDGGDRATQVTGADARFAFDNVPPGRWRLTAVLSGFVTTSVDAAVAAGESTAAAIDLAVGGVEVSVDVVAPTAIVPSVGTLARADSVNAAELEQLAAGGGFQAALRLLASVIEVPGGVSIKGGRPSQASVQLGSTTLVDASTGLTHVSLPDDAIDSVEVLPNPYSVEFGRFSSGLVVIQTRRAGDAWKTRVNNLEPAFRTPRNGNPFHIKGLSYFSPRIETGGPLVRDRLFLEQTAQLRYSTSDVPSRPQDELKIDRWFSSFTRVDAGLSPRHSLVATGGVFPRVSKYSNLGTFIPPESTVDLHSVVSHAAVTERALWTDALFTETSAQVHRYTTRVEPRSAAVMELLPQARRGGFFNRQQRETTTYQLIETASGVHRGRGGLHQFKFGLDLLHSRYEGTSESRPVLVRRPDGTLARRLDFGAPASQRIASTDIALFLQDRVQPTDRWYVEAGARIDRDGIAERLNVTPRLGSVVLLDASGSATLRGGIGLFFERTPSTAGVFAGFEDFVETRYDEDGSTLLGAPVRFRHTVGDLRTPRGRTWDLAYDQRFNPHVAVHVGVIDRRGSHELIVSPVRGAGGGELRLDSAGRSLYREAEVGLHLTYGHGIDLSASYVRSVARADLNALTAYFDTILAPIVGENSYAPAEADVPHRLLLRGRVMPTDRWLITSIVDWRTGLPYSVVDAYLDFVGPRNQGRRFPNFARYTFGAEHRFEILGKRPWIGVRILNALGSFLPVDVQNNIASEAFGTFYNSEYRQFRLQVRFER
ncbi:MAG: TonB-dependent receptor [Acidobacteria bacterium]|nr:TonB-dependent receptor [Acidobacteriota bacterium]